MTVRTFQISLAFLAAAAVGLPNWQDEDTGKKTFQKVCLDCHGGEMVRGSGRTKAGWQATVDEMVQKGARANDDEIETIVEYLAETFPPPKININTISASDLRFDLEFSGKAAAALVAYREKHGKIKTLEELESIPDVEVAKIEAKKDRLVF
jgi:competence ComEA-like helix-hairpin-helix protein